MTCFPPSTLEQEAETLKAIIADEDGQKQKKEKAVKRLEVVDAFLKGQQTIPRT